MGVNCLFTTPLLLLAGFISCAEYERHLNINFQNASYTEKLYKPGVILSYIHLQWQHRDNTGKESNEEVGSPINMDLAPLLTIATLNVFSLMRPDEIW